MCTTAIGHLPMPHLIARSANACAPSERTGYSPPAPLRQRPTTGPLACCRSSGGRRGASTLWARRRLPQLQLQRRSVRGAASRAEHQPFIASQPAGTWHVVFEGTRHAHGACVVLPGGNMCPVFGTTCPTAHRPARTRTPRGSRQHRGSRSCRSASAPRGAGGSQRHAAVRTAHAAEHTARRLPSLKSTIRRLLHSSWGTQTPA